MAEPLVLKLTLVRFSDAFNPAELEMLSATVPLNVWVAVKVIVEFLENVAFSVRVLRLVMVKSGAGTVKWTVTELTGREVLLGVPMTFTSYPPGTTVGPTFTVRLARA